MTLSEQRSGAWRELNALLAAHGLDVPDIDEFVASSESASQSAQSDSNTSQLNLSVPKGERDWNSVFGGIDLSKANDISNAYRRFKHFEPPLDHECFFAEACKRVTVGQEAEFVVAIAETAEFALPHCRIFLEQIPDTWKPRLIIRPIRTRKFGKKGLPAS